MWRRDEKSASLQNLRRHKKSKHPWGAANVQHAQKISSNSSNERENTLLFPNAAMSVTNGPFSTSRVGEREKKSGFRPGSLLLLCMGSQRVVTQVDP